jgi:hypothetical protein
MKGNMIANKCGNEKIAVVVTFLKSILQLNTIIGLAGLDKVIRFQLILQEFILRTLTIETLFNSEYLISATFSSHIDS